MPNAKHSSRANTLLHQALEDLDINAPYWVVKETKTTITLHFLGRLHPVTWRKPRTRKAAKAEA